MLAVATLEETITNLESLHHLNARHHNATRNYLEGKMVGKYWININNPRTPCNTLRSLRIPLSNPLTLTSKSSDMAQLAQDYHESIQLQDLPQFQPPDEDNVPLQHVLDHLKPRVLPNDKNDLAKMVKLHEVQQAIC